MTTGTPAGVVALNGWATSAVPVGDAARVGEARTVAVGVRVAVGEGVGARVAVGEGVGMSVAVGEGVRVAVAVGVRVAVAVAVRVGVGWSAAPAHDTCEDAPSSTKQIVSSERSFQ